MPKRFRKVFKVFFAWQDDKEEEWLNEMARNGWHFASYVPFVYIFERAEPADYIYKLDYKATTNADLDEYLGFFEDAGWEHVDQFLGWHYFRIKADNTSVPDIYSDNASKVQKYRGLMRTLIVIAAANSFSVINFLSISSDIGRLSLIGVLPIAVFLTLVYAIYRIHLKIESLKNGGS